MEQLRLVVPEPHSAQQSAGGMVVYSLFGDLVYPQHSMYAYAVFGGNINPPQGSHQAAWKTQMSEMQHDVVEWQFSNIMMD